MNIIELRGDIYSWTVSDIGWRLSENKDKEVTLRVNSFGGDLNAAMVISQKIADHGKVTVQYIGLNASAATIIGFGAQKSVMAEDAMWLIHKPLALVDAFDYMNSDDIESTINELQKQKKTLEALDLVVANKYAKKSGKCVKDIIDLMKEEKWMTSEEVSELGLVDEVIAPSGEIKNHAKLLVQNCIDLKLPVPTFENKKEAKLPTEPNLVDIIINKCKELFAPKNNENNPQKEISMNKNFVALMAVLSVEELEEQDGKITLSAEQMELINNAIAENNSAKDELSQVAEILNKVEGNDEVDGIVNKAQKLLDVVNAAPVNIVDTVVPEEKHEAETESDFINSIVKAL